MKTRRLATFALFAACATHVQAMEVLIPSYFRNEGSNNPWTQLNAAAGQVGLTAILNPASGPGTTLDPTYLTGSNALRAAGGRVIAYVSTNYANRSISAVKADIDKYRSLYGNFDGFFLDEMQSTNDAAAIAFYGQVYSYIKSLDANYRVVGNPGVASLPVYLTTPGADALITFENGTGYNSFNAAPWTTNFATRRFSNIPYQINGVAAMQAAVTRAANNRVGYMYVTDDSGANPWDTLPTYWADELNAIRAITPTWVNNASGSWNTASNWTTGTAPNGIDAQAYLLGAITTPQTLYTNTPITLGTLVFNNANRYDLNGAGSLTMNTSVEGALIDVRQGTHTVNVPLTLSDPTTAFINAGATLNIADPLTIGVGASLTKSGPGTLLITSTVTNALPLSIVAGDVALQSDATLSSLSIAEAASLDIGDQALTIRAADASTLRRALRSAYANGTWSGPGLTSGLADNAHGVACTSAPDGSTSLHLALYGDVTLDGHVSLDDLLAIVASTGDSWTTGDFNYDGVSDAADLALVQANYAGDFASDWNLAQALAPEPTMAIGLLVLARRRR